MKKLLATIKNIYFFIKESHTYIGHRKKLFGISYYMYDIKDILYYPTALRNFLRYSKQDR